MTVAALYPDTNPSLLLDFANVKALDPRITFTRAAPAVYYDGKTFAKAEENLLQYSQQFEDAYWTKDNATITANAIAAPDGTLTGEKLVENTSNSTHFLRVSVLARALTTYTQSVYLKVGERNRVQIQMYGNSGGSTLDINLGTQTVTSAGGYGGWTSPSGTITDVGNGWYRISHTVTTNSGLTSFTFGIFLLDNSGVGSYTGDGTSGVYVWGAQLEQRSSVTAYTPTTTQPITNYIPVLQTAASGMARFDHDPVTGESLGLLIEEQRTNLSIRSEEFNRWNNSYIETQVAVFANTAIAPDGTLTADKVAPLSGTGGRGIGLTITGLTGTAVTTTVYAKAAERSLIQIRWFGGAPGISFAYANFDLINGTTAGDATISISMTPVGNGWWRCVASTAITGTLASQEHVIEFIDSLSDGRRPTISSGNGFNGVYLWGAQLEAGAFPTSYIKTEASQVTRSADVASMTGTNFSSWYRQDEGTLFVDAIPTLDAGSFRGYVSFNDGTLNTRIDLITYGTALTSGIAVRINSVLQADLATGTTPSKSRVKLVGAYKVNDFATTNNYAATVAVDSSGNIPAVNSANIGSYVGFVYINGPVRKLAYYPKRLTNAQLQALTR